MSQNVLLSDGFESGTLLRTDMPAGQWDTFTQGTLVMVDVGDAGAHEGSHGLQIVDTAVTTGSSAAQLQKAIAPGENALTLRMWMDVEPSNTSQAQVAELRMAGGPIATVSFSGSSGGALQVACHKPGSTIFMGGFGDGLGWHYLELALEGLNTSAGACRVSLDGHSRTPVTNLDWTTFDVTSVSAGQLAGDDSFLGSIRIDDVLLTRGGLDAGIVGSDGGAGGGGGGGDGAVGGGAAGGGAVGGGAVGGGDATGNARGYVVGCGCSEASGAGAAALLIVLLLARRRQGI